MINYKNRPINFGVQSRVYRNLHTKKGEYWYSIQQQIEGRWLVVAHAQNLVLEDVKFKVSKSGVAKIRRENKKAVVAVIEGKILEAYQTSIGENFRYFTLNPYKWWTFVDCTTEKELTGASIVAINKEITKYSKF